MHDTTAISAATAPQGRRFNAHPFISIVTGAVLSFAPVPLTMILVHHLVDKPYRVVWPQLLAALLSFLAYRFFAHRIEKRALTEFAAAGAARDSALGLGLGAGMVCTVFAVLALLGVYRLDGVNGITPLLFLPLAELLLVGLAEESVFRGIVFRITEQAIGSMRAIVVSAMVFALAHLPNEGVGPVAVAALAAYGVLQAAIYMRTRTLWLCIASHVAWNFCVGQVFSTAVSGHASQSGLLQGQLAGPSWLAGGAFGVEGSLLTLIVISAVAACFLRAGPRREAPARERVSA
ncbi:CPBP family intramembrane glutamic endopeptidase [Massilia sp. DD77]|uniref:CPBP family intramembrane glutamic endopeptidase n=1 Tax=Massilia sp. DD77 TaxID=3109349 RepID=UPI003000F2F4